MNLSSLIITDATIPTTDVTTNDASTTKHGWALKATAPTAGLTSYVGISYGETVYSMKAAPTPASLGLVIGTTVQAYDADLTTWAGITPGTGIATALAVNVGSTGAPVLQGGAAAVTTLSASGIITSTVTAGQVVKAESGATGLIYSNFSNTGGSLQYGVDNSTGSAIYSGSSAYAAFIGTSNATPIVFATSNVVRATISSTGLAVTGALSATTTIRPGGYTVGTLPAGTAGMKCYITDAIAPAFLTTLVGGGSAYSGAQYSGSAWVGD